jgi:hypothetical protein
MRSNHQHADKEHDTNEHYDKYFRSVLVFKYIRTTITGGNYVDVLVTNAKSLGNVTIQFNRILLASFLLNNSVQQSALEAYTLLTSQEISRIFWNTKVHNRIHNNPPFFPV